MELKKTQKHTWNRHIHGTRMQVNLYKKNKIDNTWAMYVGRSIQERQKHTWNGNRFSYTHIYIYIIHIYIYINQIHSYVYT